MKEEVIKFIDKYEDKVLIFIALFIPTLILILFAFGMYKFKKC